MPSDSDIVVGLYERFNARDIDAVLALLRPDVVWANGMDGGHVHGREAVRDYWTRQWAMIDPHVEPIGTESGAPAQVVVQVLQTVRNLDGELVAERTIEHRFQLEEGLIARFDIGES